MTYKIDSIILYLLVFFCLVNCNSNSADCGLKKHIKSEKLTFYQAKKSNDTFKLETEIPMSFSIFSYNRDGSIMSSEDHFLSGKGDFKTLTNYLYEDDFLKKMNTATYTNNELVEESSKELLVKSHDKNKNPLLITDDKETFKKVYTYKNCLETTEIITNLIKNKVVKDKNRTYDSKGNIKSSVSKYNYDKQITDTMLFINYKYNNKGDWVYRVIKNSDDSYLIEKRFIEYR